MPPSIGEIPTAAQLQQQLDTLNNAITALGQSAPVTNLTVGVPPDQPDPTIFIMPIPIVMNPPITDPTTIADLITVLTVQAESIETQLINMGYAPPTTRTAEIAEEAQANIYKDIVRENVQSPGVPMPH